MQVTQLQKLFKTTKVLALALGMTFAATSAQATTWYGSYGVVMSDTCVAPNGAFLTFTNGNYGVVNSPCSFSLLYTPGVVFNGVFR